MENIREKKKIVMENLKIKKNFGRRVLRE